MSLTRRLLLTIGCCLLPMVVAFAIALFGLYEQRLGRIDALATRQMELTNADVASIIEGAQSLLLALGQIPVAADCPRRAAELQRGLPAYDFFAVLDDTGRLVCGSRPDLATSGSERPVWLDALSGRDGFHIGTYSALPAVRGGFLPLGLIQRDPAGKAHTLVVALDLQWLARHVAVLKTANDATLTNSDLLLADRNGTILARVPDADRWAGEWVGSGMMALVDAGQPGTVSLPGLDGQRRLTAYIPAGVSPEGLFLAVGLYEPDLVADFWTTIAMGVLLGSVALLIAFAIAYWAVRRFFQLPAQLLLRSVRLWRGGDLTARAPIPGGTAEFGHLAETFNEMAAAIEARQAEQEQQSKLLESLVAERTRELSGSNNRLQVEIAERQRAELVLHQAQKLQAVGQLAGGVAHDFNNLLATILGSLELMERRIPEGDTKLPTLVTRAMDAVQRGAQLTSRLLAFSRRQRLAARSTDINRLITDLVGLATSALGRRVRVETELGADVWSAMVDPSQLEAAILNLSLNARDAMPQGGVLTLATANEAVGANERDADAGDYVRITVADTGTGMSREVLARAFEPFFTTKELGQGSGLGLSQVYGLARQSGGTVRIHSEPGRGTTVTMLLPRAQAETARVAGSEARPGEPRARSEELVLLVDDDPDVRQVSVEMLRDLGYQVVEAAGGEEALTTVRRLPSPPALLVLDYAMPGMNGLQLAAELRALGIGAPMLLATGYAELSGDRSGVTPDAILHKPFSLAEFDRTLNRLKEHGRAPA